MFRRLKNGAAVVLLPVLMLCMIGIADASGQVNSPVVSGWAGEGLQWNWHPDDATLFIRPSGDNRAASQWNYLMVHGQFSTLCVDRRVKVSVSKLVIEEGVKRIGYQAFKDMSSLSNVYFPSTLGIIDDQAFSYGYNLRKIVLPASNHTIRFKAFYKCPLREIVAMSTRGYNVIQEDADLGEGYEFFERSYVFSYPYTRLFVPDGFTFKYKNTWPWFYLYHYYGTDWPVVLVTDVTLDKEYVRLYSKGKTAQLTATLSPSNATDNLIRWYSSDESIVHVSQDGKITALKPGEVTITAIAHNHCMSNLRTTCQVEVRPIGTDATLKNITVDGTDVSGFSADTQNYTVTVPFSTTSATVTGEAADQFASVSGETKPLAVRDNIFIVAVTAEDRTTRTNYKVNIRRQSVDATLKNLMVNGTNVSGFNANTQNYTVTVPPLTTSVMITAEANHASATVSGTGQKTVYVGNNAFTIMVTAEDGSQRTYFVTVTVMLPPTYAYSVNANGGTVSGGTQAGSYPKGTTIRLPSSITRSGYNFAGFTSSAWSGTKSRSSTFTMPAGNTTVTATWGGATYTVTLNWNGGSGSSMASYVYGVSAMLPVDGTKTGYVFSGWYANYNLTGNAVAAISATDMGNKTFYAKWTPATGISYSSDSGGNRIGRVIVLGSANVRASTVPDSAEATVLQENIDCSTGDEFLEADIRIYPNPTKGHFAVEIGNLPAGTPCGLYLYTAGGQVLEKKTPGTEKKLYFDLSRQNTGIYILNININGKISTWKIIKQ
jgi:uncharacterized repeat protein (TIGR02543 family)